MWRQQLRKSAENLEDLSERHLEAAEGDEAPDELRERAEDVRRRIEEVRELKEKAENPSYRNAPLINSLDDRVSKRTGVRKFKELAEKGLMPAEDKIHIRNRHYDDKKAKRDFFFHKAIDYGILDIENQVVWGQGLDLSSSDGLSIDTSILHGEWLMKDSEDVEAEHSILSTRGTSVLSDSSNVYLGDVIVAAGGVGGSSEDFEAESVIFHGRGFLYSQDVDLEDFSLEYINGHFLEAENYTIRDGEIVCSNGLYDSERSAFSNSQYGLIESVDIESKNDRVTDPAIFPEAEDIVIKDSSISAGTVGFNTERVVVMNSEINSSQTAFNGAEEVFVYDSEINADYFAESAENVVMVNSEFNGEKMGDNVRTVEVEGLDREIEALYTMFEMNGIQNNPHESPYESAVSCLPTDYAESEIEDKDAILEVSKN